MSKLTAKQFDSIAKDNFGKTLNQYGFSCEESKCCTFYRKVSDDIYFFIMPDKSRSSPKYDIKIFPHSPILESDFDSKFPDCLGVTTDCFGYLHSTRGVGPNQEWFWCRTKEGFVRNFEQKVAPALIEYAIPFLEQVKTMSDMQKVVKRGPFLQRIEAYLNGA